ncbi:MAG TPA: hypothetical protein VFI31_04555, partial [Pirellulales bacterium]|nr:hypothetical protein [Pirellulales bacterium]
MSWSRATVTVRWPELFCAPRRPAAENFLRSALQMSEVRSVLLDEHAGTARVDLRPGAVIAETLRRLATAAKSDAVGQGGPDFGHAALRRMRQPRFHLFRHGDRVSTWEVLHEQPGRVRLRHDLLRSDPLLPNRIDAALGNIDGVAGAVSRPLTGTVLIHFDPHSIDSGRLLEILDEALEEPAAEPNALHPSEIRFGMANTSLALAA